MNVRPFAVIVAVASSVTFGGWIHRAPGPEKDEGKRKAMSIQSDYDALTGRWQLVKSVVDGTPVPEAEVKKTALITDHDVFRFPADAHVGTAPQGRFTIDPTRNPKEVDSTALDGPNEARSPAGSTRSWAPTTSAPAGANPEAPGPPISPARRAAAERCSTGG